MKHQNSCNSAIKAQIVTIGDEILIGQIVDTNSAFIASMLEGLGVKIESIVSISDTQDAIYNTLKESTEKYDITIATGGLGPTRDDITKNVLCQIFDCSMQLHSESLSQLEILLAARNLEMNELNYSQAMLPTAATIIPNKNGTAPGLMFEKDGNLLFNLPGVPFEMKGLMDDYVKGIILERFALPHTTHRTAITFGIPESTLAIKIADWEDNLAEGVKLAYLPSPKGVRLRLTYRTNDTNGDAIVDAEFKKLEQIIGDNIAGYGDESSIESLIAKYLTTNSLTLSVAESCTGGCLASMFTAMDGASAYFNGGIVSYSNSVKINVLGVDADIIEQHGAVSRECALSMARNVREKLSTNYSIATTGIAGPSGGTADKPVGTVWIAVASPQGVRAERYQLGELRDVNIKRFTNKALSLLLEELGEKM